MDLEGIFGLFGFSEENNKKKLKELEALKDTPRFKLGMFHKLVMKRRVARALFDQPELLRSEDISQSEILKELLKIHVPNSIGKN